MTHTYRKTKAYAVKKWPDKSINGGIGWVERLADGKASALFVCIEGREQLRAMRRMGDAELDAFCSNLDFYR